MAEIVDAFTKGREAGGNGDLVPAQLLRRIASAANGRLLDHHHLHMEVGGDHDAIRRLVSPDLWALLRPTRVGTAPETPPHVAYDELERLLDEVERL